MTKTSLIIAILVTLGTLLVYVGAPKGAGGSLICLGVVVFTLRGLVRMLRGLGRSHHRPAYDRRRRLGSGQGSGRSGGERDIARARPAG